MVDFEEGITFECLGLYDKAIQLYENLSNKEIGLPVEHWRKRAEFFLGRAKQKNNGRIYSDMFSDNFSTVDRRTKDALYEIQWTAFYELHSFVYLPNHIRYLAISSMSRIDSEPAMAIVIFRTCLEGLLKILYPNEYEENEKDKKNLGNLISILFDSGILFTKKNKKADIKNDKCFIVKERGNFAAHGVDVEYSYKYLCETIIMFIEILHEGNTLISEKIEKQNKE